MSQSIGKKVISRIYGRGRGWAFSSSDFSDMAPLSAINVALHRLAKKGTIRRAMRGVYDYPRHSELLGQAMGPDIHRVALALARKFNWRIQPGGPAALSLISLSNQVPSQYVYLSDGPARTYRIGKTTLMFKHHALKETGFQHEESGVIVQAIKALGEDNLNDKTIGRIRDWLPKDKRAAVLKETRQVTGWIYAAIKRICRENGDG